MNYNCKIRPLAAYVAGFFDGEGTVYIRFYKNSNGKPVYRCQLAIGNTNLSVLQMIKKHFGGYISFHKSKNKRWKDYYMWSLWNRKIIKFLKAIKPYSIIKKKQINLALDFYKIIRTNVRTIPLTKDELEKRHSFFIQLKNLNKKGPF